ncbi:MAG: FIST C-terminal domain-containing protein [Candidatus Adiutrix sp.]|nr:FIST C-terminal domain-containing protein [Candidatus Adiutrix sp.]
MHAGVGYSDTPDTYAAGRQVALDALKQGGLGRPCDLVLLFFTAAHEAGVLRDAVASVVGAGVPIVGGAAVGVISNERFGYAGDQIVLAAFWFEGARCDFLAEGGLKESEEATGCRLGRRLAGLPEFSAASSLMLFYDAIDREDGRMRLVMATPLIAGLERGLGFLPNLIGAGLQGDYAASATRQIAEREVVRHHALALSFSGAVTLDNVIMHGCRPGTGYFTVTKSDMQTVLEINGKPALSFITSLLKNALTPDELPFSLILGVNRGKKWSRFDEKSYANRLCLAVDKERDGLVMFEPDMVAGTEFQVMYRSFDLDYIPPRIEKTFADAEAAGRKPVFALYIDCAGRAAGYAGTDLEDALMVQKSVAGRVPLMGIYSGVEIAPVEGRPRGLDWTGVFCLFSVPR